MENQGAVDGARIRALRKERKWSQAQLAAQIGRDDAGQPIDQSTISNIERGDVLNPRYETVASIARALGVTPESLRPGAEVRQPQEPAAADEVLRLTYQTVQRLEREVRLLREQLATYGVAPPQKEPEVSEEPSTPAGRPGDIVPADPRTPERAEEPDIFRMVREALDKLPGGHLIPLDREKVTAQYKAPGPTTLRGLQSVVNFLAKTHRDDWLLDHGMDEDELERRAREGRTLED